MFPRLFASFAFVAPLVACASSSPSAPATTNGVDDVLLACQIRAKWNSTSTTPCNNCMGLTITPRCPCSDQDYAGKCSDQQAAKNNEPTCNGVSGCVNACATGDCACVDACYAGKDACRKLGSAVDGCVAEVCDAYCR